MHLQGCTYNNFAILQATQTLLAVTELTVLVNVLKVKHINCTLVYVFFFGGGDEDIFQNISGM